ncbi:MAG: DUF2855 family protein [Proteobacteria bacterium]|nr:DUF2855 family protein [Pseudomonadota bacterium]
MTDATEIKTFEVRRDDFATTRLFTEIFDGVLSENEVLLKVNRFALTANNISYCVSGDLLGYWQFFPAEEGWGRVPVMGYGEVVATAHADIDVGEKVWGFFPMSSHLKILAGRVGEKQFVDVSPHRAELAPIYSQFQRAAANPIYEVQREDQDSLLRGLFLTSFLCEDFMYDNNCFGAEAYLITSASSKTSIALAFAVKRRGEKQTVGITSPGNVDFCQGLGCYDRVVVYGELQNLDAEQPVVLVDMSGNAEVISGLHHHYQDNLCYSCMIGATHYKDMGSTDNLPGAKPEFFFAPSQAQKRAGDWGAGEMERRIGSSFVEFREFSDGWLRVERETGSQAISDCFLKTLAGAASPEQGCILSMWEK